MHLLVESRKSIVKESATITIGDVEIEFVIQSASESEAPKKKKKKKKVLKQSVSQVDSPSSDMPPEVHIYTNGGLMDSFTLAMKTMPFIMMRLGILVGFSIATVLWIVLCTTILSPFLQSDVGQIVYFVILGMPFGLFMFLRNYVLYMLKAAHIACLTELVYHNEIPGSDMISYGKDVVKEEFPQINVMFVVDQLVKGVVKSFNRGLDFIASLLPIPGLDSVMGIVKRVVDMSTTYIDETIMSYSFLKKGNVWANSRDGLIYYAQNAKPILKTAIFAVVFDYSATIILTIICFIPTKRK